MFHNFLVVLNKKLQSLLSVKENTCPTTIILEPVILFYRFNSSSSSFILEYQSLAPPFRNFTSTVPLIVLLKKFFIASGSPYKFFIFFQTRTPPRKLLLLSSTQTLLAIPQPCNQLWKTQLNVLLNFFLIRMHFLLS